MAVGLSKASYYRKAQTGKDQRKTTLDSELVMKLKSLSGYETIYGYRKVSKLLGRHNHKKVYRHMKALNLLQPRKLKKHGRRRLNISCAIQSNARWEADLTYVFDGYQTNYLFVVVDTFDKEPIGEHYGLRCRAEEAVQSLENAVRHRFGSLAPSSQTRVCLRVDQGSQYVSAKFKTRAKELGVHLEFCGINCPDDKPYIESFFSRYKCEEVYRNEYRSYLDASNAWLFYQRWYSTKRIHQGLKYKTIPQFKQQNSSLQFSSILSHYIGA